MEIVRRIKQARKPLMSTIHTKPVLNTVASSRLSPKWPVRKMRTELGNKRHTDLVLPLAQSNLVIVHNSFARKQLIELGFDENKLIIKPIPVPSLSPSSSFVKEIEEIKNKIHYQPGDFIFATVGYLSRVKGCIQIVKAVALLPPHYKLLIFGGIHPRGGNDETLDELGDLIVSRGLQDRVFISGFVEDDNLLNAYVSSVDLLVFPYLREYVSSSAALNNGFANEKPILAFPLDTFKEVTLNGKQVMTFCESFSYYDLVKSIQTFTPEKIKKATLVSKEYRNAFSYNRLSKELIELYTKIARVT
jgi:glycosyltransferase involved in cell wall biosynthesis